MTIAVNDVLDVSFRGLVQSLRRIEAASRIEDALTWDTMTVDAMFAAARRNYDRHVGIRKLLRQTTEERLAKMLTPNPPQPEPPRTTRDAPPKARRKAIG